MKYSSAIEINFYNKGSNYQAKTNQQYIEVNLGIRVFITDPFIEFNAQH